MLDLSEKFQFVKISEMPLASLCGLVGVSKTSILQFCSVQLCNVQFCNVQLCNIQLCNVQFCNAQLCNVQFCNVQLGRMVQLSSLSDLDHIPRL